MTWREHELRDTCDKRWGANVRHAGKAVTMGFFDSIKERLNFGGDDDYFDDDFEEYYDDDDDEPERDTSGILGNTRRPEAESVSVYTRSGRPVASNAGSASAGYGYPVETGTYTPDYRSSYGDAALTAQNTGRGALGTAGTTTPGDVGLTPMPRGFVSQLPPYVLKPVAYEDVQMVVKRVRTNQPVVLSFKNTPIEVAKRILDFSFGFTTGIGGAVEELGDRAFVVLPANMSLSQSDLDKLAADGVISR